MPYLKLYRLGQILYALALAVLIAWLGFHYNQRSRPDDSGPEGVRLLNVSTVKLEYGQPATPEQVLGRGDWVPVGQTLSTGWSLKPLWARLELDNTTPFFREVWLEVTPPRLAHVHLHQRSAQGAWHANASGVLVPIKERRIHVPDIVFPVQLQPYEKRVVLVQVDNAATPFNLAFALHEPVAFAGVKVQSSLTDLLLVGATLALGVICLYIGVALRQPMHLLLGLRSVLLSSWLLQQLGVLSLLLPSAVVTALFEQAVWIAWVILALTTSFVWLFLVKTDVVGLPKWTHTVFGLLASLFVLSAALALSGLLPLVQLAIRLGELSLVATLFELVLSAWMVWRGQGAANMILVTSCTSLLINSKVHLAVLRINDTDVLRQVVSPIPILITSAVLFVGITVQLLRERQARQALRWQDYQHAMTQLEGKVAERTEALQGARDEAQRANAAKSLFMAKISHELRTPMHAVLGYVGLVLRDKPPEAIARRLHVAHRAGEQLVGQIDDLLDYVRAGRDQLRTTTTAFALPMLIENVTQRAALLANESGNQFHWTPVAGLPTTLLGDSLRIEQVLMVLLSNAMRYTQRGHVTLRIEATDTEAIPASHSLHFSVIDTGRGMSPDALAGIFGLFQRGASTDSEGLGLGLPIAQHILALMGSHLDVRTQPGQGSIFSFTLALPSAAASDATPLPEAHVGRNIVGYSGSTLQILLLEDKPASRQYLQELLGDLGFSVCAVTTVDAATQAVREQVAAQGAQAPDGVGRGFDLYLVDQHLEAGQSGWDFVRYLRSAPELPATARTQAVLMLSATQASAPPDWNPAHSVTQHLLKPLSAAQLTDALTTHLHPAWIESEQLAVDARALAPATPPNLPPDLRPELMADTESWAQLRLAAEQGSVSQLNAWRGQNGALRQAHPTLEPLINRLDFVRLAQYAQDLSKSHP